MSQSGYNKAIGNIRERFLERLAAQYERSQELVGCWSGTAKNTEPLEEFCAIAHKVAGLAKTVGYSELGSAAFNADSIIQKWLDDKRDNISEADVSAAIDQFMAISSQTLSAGRAQE